MEMDPLSSISLGSVLSRAAISGLLGMLVLISIGFFLSNLKLSSVFSLFYFLPIFKESLFLTIMVLFNLSMFYLPTLPLDATPGELLVVLIFFLGNFCIDYISCSEFSTSPTESYYSVPV
jgi:hypothetical protein